MSEPIIHQLGKRLTACGLPLTADTPTSDVNANCPDCAVVVAVRAASDTSRYNALWGKVSQMTKPVAGPQQQQRKVTSE